MTPRLSILPLFAAAVALAAFAWLGAPATAQPGGTTRPTTRPAGQPLLAPHTGETPATQDAPTTAPATQATAPAEDDRPTTGTPRIIVKWAIETATNNYGYNIFRTDQAEPADDDWVKLNRRVLSGVGTTATPHVFRYLDTDVGHDLDKVWYYKVQEIDLDGRRTYFSHPVTGESPFILAGKPRVMNKAEEETFAETRFVIEALER